MIDFQNIIRSWSRTLCKKYITG